MKIQGIFTHHVGPFSDQHFSFDNDWTGKPETKVLLTGPNGCGKSTLLRAVAVLWEACAYWLDHQKPLPQKHEARVWLQRWGGLAVIFDGMKPFYDLPVGIAFGERSWIESVMHQFPDIVWLGETVHRGVQGRPTRKLHLSGKQLDPDIKNGEGRLRVKLGGRGADTHLLDDLSDGEHQVLILIYLISRFLQPEGIVLIDEPDLYLHPSLIIPLLSTLEQLVQIREGQFILTSHSVEVWERYEQSGMRIELGSKPLITTGRFTNQEEYYEAMA